MKTSKTTVSTKRMSLNNKILFFLFFFYFILTSYYSFTDILESSYSSSFLILVGINLIYLSFLSVLVSNLNLNYIHKDVFVMQNIMVEISPLKMGRKTETGHWKWLVIRQLCNAFFYQLLPFYGVAL